MRLIEKVDKVKLVQDIDELNTFIKEDWILLLAIPSPDGTNFILGHLKSDNASFISSS